MTSKLRLLLLLMMRQHIHPDPQLMTDDTCSTGSSSSLFRRLLLHALIYFVPWIRPIQSKVRKGFISCTPWLAEMIAARTPVTLGIRLRACGLDCHYRIASSCIYSVLVVAKARCTLAQLHVRLIKHIPLKD